MAAETSATAASKTSVFPRDGVRYPLSLRTYCSAACWISSAVAGGSAPRSVWMLLHMPRTVPVRLPTMPWGRIIAVAAPGVVLAAVGLTHPTDLNSGTAGWWTTMHTLLLPLFPLLGVSVWLLVRGLPGPLPWLAAAAAFGYAAFYGALDVLAGIATGALVERGASADGDEVQTLFRVGNDLGAIGVGCFLVACLLAALAVARQAGWRALPGAAFLVASAITFLNSHIYWPVGGAAMLGLALGFGLLAALPARGAIIGV